jgi:hypothetical protein
MRASHVSVESIKVVAAEEEQVMGRLVKRASEKLLQGKLAVDQQKPAKLKMGWLYKRNRHGFRYLCCKKKLTRHPD